MNELPEPYRQQMQQKAQQSQLRRRRVMQRHADGTVMCEDGRRRVNFSDNDYLGLSWHPQVQQAAQQAVADYGAGAGASRLISGNHPPFAALEESLARFKGTEDCLVFGSGYLTNIGVIPALAGRGDLILADRLIHASLVDGVSLSGAHFRRFSHNDTDHLQRLLEGKRSRYRQCVILTEGVFSMDGDTAPLAALYALAERFDALLVVDDAHGFGILGQGRGACSAAGLDAASQRLLQIGTLSKALGAYGGYVCGTAAWVEYLLQFSRSGTYSTALPPSVLASARAALDVLQAEPWRAESAMRHARYFCESLALPPPQSPIVPYRLGENEAALQAADALAEAGFLTVAIRPPTVPQGTARLRLTFSASHHETQLEALVTALVRHNRA